MKPQLAWIPLLLLGAVPACPAQADLDAAIARNRMGTLVVRTAPGARVTIQQTRHEFWFGATLATRIFNGQASPEDMAKFEEVFTSHFNAGVIESAFKWHDMEKEPGMVNYAIVDKMLDWADQRRIPLRGHCMYWGVPQFVQKWVSELNDDQLRRAVAQRGRATAARYRGRFAEYDLNNEMIHANLYEKRLGPSITKEMAQWVHEGDPEAKLFLNDYDILTGNRLADYVTDIRRLLDMGVPVAGIGVQGHLHGETFDPAAVQRALDELAQFKLPIRVTEFNLPGQRSRYYREDRKAVLTPEQEKAKAEGLREYFRICFAHPAVTGILMWGFWEGANWIPQSSLYKRDWTPTPAAQAYRDLVLKEWWTRHEGTANAQGWLVIPAFFGTYRVTAQGQEAMVELKKSEGVQLVTLN